MHNRDFLNNDRVEHSQFIKKYQQMLLKERERKRKKKFVGIFYNYRNL